MPKNKTIVALATPPGISGLAIVRLSGEKSLDIADKCFYGKKSLSESKTHRIHLGIFKDGSKIIDTVTAAVFKNPKSYTGENSVELTSHGGPIIYEAIIRTLIKQGAVLAEAGEFTKRAFLNGKMDMAQAEAVADLIRSTSIPGALTSARQLVGGFNVRLQKYRKELFEIISLLELELDFSEEDIEFVNKTKILDKILSASEYCLGLAGSYKSAEILRSGYFVAIAGYPNSGKSTLFNALLQRDRAIVSEIPGTTRDFLEETIYIKGVAIRLTDTAGIRNTDNTIEIEGIKYGESAFLQANMILIVNDVTLGSNQSDELFNRLTAKYSEADTIMVQNKADLVENIKSNDIVISAKECSGLGRIIELIEKKAKCSKDAVSDILINQRHHQLLIESNEYLVKVREAIEAALGNEIIAFELRNAINSLGRITGETWNEEVLNNIFSRFCIGK